MPFDPPLTDREIAEALGHEVTNLVPLEQGGQGVVFRATIDSSVGQNDVALKIYFDDVLEERTTREVAALEAIRLPTLVRLVAAGSCVLRSVTVRYVATEFVQGETLLSALGRGPLSVQRVARIGVDSAQTIEALWAARIVHRDIKPGNLMLATNGRAVLIDLGLARHVALGSLTTAGLVWGTEGYMSPEQMKGRRKLTCKSDLFALGIVLQEALLGRHPTGRQQAPLLRGGLRTEVLRANLPPAFAEVIDSVLSELPESRPLPRETASKLEPFTT